MQELNEIDKQSSRNAVRSQLVSGLDFEHFKDEYVAVGIMQKKGGREGDLRRGELRAGFGGSVRK